jgi:hypothetical protein
VFTARYALSPYMKQTRLVVRWLRRPCTMDLVSSYLIKLYAIVTAVKFLTVCDTIPSGRVVRPFE